MAATEDMLKLLITLLASPIPLAPVMVALSLSISCTSQDVGNATLGHDHYSVAESTIDRVARDNRGRTTIEFTTTAETLYTCPGVRIFARDARIELLILRKRGGATHVQAIEVENPRDLPIFVIDGDGGEREARPYAFRGLSGKKSG